MNQDELKAYLAWLDDKFGLSFPEGSQSLATLWNNTVAYYDNDEIVLVVDTFSLSALNMYKEWRDYNV